MPVWDFKAHMQLRGPWLGRRHGLWLLLGRRHAQQLGLGLLLGRRHGLWR